MTLEISAEIDIPTVDKVVAGFAVQSFFATTLALQDILLKK
jgi:hypothetical protein